MNLGCAKHISGWEGNKIKAGAAEICKYDEVHWENAITGAFMWLMVKRHS